MSNFKSLNTKNYSVRGPTITQDYIYWKKLGVPVLVKEFGAIDYIDFSPVEPHYFAVTCSVRVQIYNPITKLVVKNLSRFQENAYGGVFRKDGRLLVAGDEEGLVKLFDVSSKNILRLFKGHKAPVHRASFTSDSVHIASFSDDKYVKIWDIPTEKAIHTFSGHTDYIRAGCCSPVAPNILISGGYDQIIKMYDTRTDSNIFQVSHGSPVESLIFLPTGGIFISSGGTEIKVWDSFAGGKLLAKISQHHKTVTCLRLASNGRRLLSGSLDHHVKIYDIATYETVHSITYPNAVLSIGISENDETLVAGMVDGLVSIQRKEGDEPTKLEIKQIIPSNLTNFVDEIVPEYKRDGESKHDKCLRKFEYSKALDYVLLPYVVNKTPHITVSLIQELIRRKGLQRAFAGRNHKSIASVIRFIIRYLSDYRFTRVLIDASNILLDVYEDSFDQFTGDIGRMFITLAKTLEREEEITYDFMNLEGTLNLLVAGATDSNVGQTEISSEIGKVNNIEQSEHAKQHGIINVY